MQPDDLVYEEVLAGRPDDRAEGGSATDAEIAAVVRRLQPLADAGSVADTVRRVRARLGGLGELDELIEDPTVSDVMVNGAGAVWVERRGEVHPTALRLDPGDVHRLVERIITPLGLRADRLTPLVDARLPDGSRVHIAMPPLAVDGPYVTIRRFSARTLPLDEFARPEVCDLLVEAMRARRNIVVVGGTGAGKTTLLNALCQHLDPGERVVTVEDAAELRLPGEHVVRLEAQVATADGLSAVTIRDLVRNALRMRPDRIVVGEVRGGEALDMVQAMNTGHEGCLSTCHASGPDQALRRLETMALTGDVDLPVSAVRDQLIDALDLIVAVRRGPGAMRRVTRIDEVLDDRASSRRTRPIVERGQVVR